MYLANILLAAGVAQDPAVSKGSQSWRWGRDAQASMVGGQRVGSGDFMGSRSCEGRKHQEDRQKGERSSSYPGVRAVFTAERATERPWEECGWTDAGR